MAVRERLQRRIGEGSEEEAKTFIEITAPGVPPCVLCCSIHISPGRTRPLGLFSPPPGSQHAALCQGIGDIQPSQTTQLHPQLLQRQEKGTGEEQYSPEQEHLGVAVVSSADEFKVFQDLIKMHSRNLVYSP